MSNHERPELVRLQASPAHIFAAAYVDLPHPHFAGPRQELTFALGITALRGNVVLHGLAVVLLADHQILSEQAWTAAMLRSHTGLPSLEIEEGTGLAIQHLYFNAPAYVRADGVQVTTVLSSASGESWNETLRVPVTFPQQSTDLRFPLQGNWWVIQGNDWRDTHKAEPVSQAYALDFVKLGSDNHFFRNSGVNLEDHYSFGAPVYAPASARVAFTIWDMPDMPPGQVPDPAMMQGDARRVLGNAVALSHRRGRIFLPCPSPAGQRAGQGWGSHPTRNPPWIRRQQWPFSRSAPALPPHERSQPVHRPGPARAIQPCSGIGSGAQATRYADIRDNCLRHRVGSAGGG